MLLDKMKGGLIGLAAGDALGVPVEFQPRAELKKNPVTDMRGWGTHNQPPGTWSDDTGMTLATMDSLSRGFDIEDMMERFSAWMDGAYWPYGEVFDMGAATGNAIERYRNGVPAAQCGGKGERDNGNGSLMRILPMAFYLFPKYGINVCRSAEAMRMIHAASSLTHAHPRALVGCGFYVAIACALLSGQDIHTATTTGVMEAAAYYFPTPMKQELNAYARLADIDTLCNVPSVILYSSGYVVHTLEAALYCLNNTRSFEECALMAVNLGDDTDTVAAVACGLAGIAYGEKSIPASWRILLPKRGEMDELCRAVYNKAAQI